MPELPEVEDAVRRLRSAAVGRTIIGVHVRHRAVRATLPAAHARQLRGRTITRVDRRGKNQIIVLDDDTVLQVHFRMAGDWDVGLVTDGLPLHARFVLELSGGCRVALVDSRALSTIRRNAHGPQLPDLGLEATDPALDGVALGLALAKRRAPIKTALLDQRVVAGLGNIYVAEALWAARIDPRASAASLSPARLARLADGIRMTIDVAMAAPGRYSSGESAPLHVYDREGQPCDRCGSRIRRLVQSGRSTYYCGRCQR